MSKDQNTDRDPHDGEYIGNIWGWRISMIGLAVIVLLSALAAWRHYSLGVPPGLDTIDARELPSDTLPAMDS